MPNFAGFEDQKYVSITTYKKDGSTASTPVWIVPRDGKLYVWTSEKSLKVKRLARDPRCTVAPCNASGKTLYGPPVAATASFVPPADRPPIVDALKARYGFGYTLIAFINRFRNLGEYTVVELVAA